MIVGGFFSLLLIGLLVVMSWRILEKAGFPGWPALAQALTLTGFGLIVPLVFFWILAFIRWPRDDLAAVAGDGGLLPRRPETLPPDAGEIAPQALPPPPRALAPPALTVWVLEGKLADGTPGRLTIDDSRAVYLVSGSDSAEALLIPDPSVGSPHARILTAPGRIGLEDLGSPGGTWIDGVRLLPAHGPRDIGQSRLIRFGAVELALQRQ